MWQIISTYIGIFFMMIGVISFGIIIIDKPLEMSKLKILTNLLLICIIHTFLYLCFDGTVKTILVSIINMILYMQLFNINMKKSIFLTFLYLIIILISEFIQLLFVKLTNMNIEYCYNSYAGSIVSNIIACLILLTITFISRKILKRLTETKIDNNIEIVIFSILILLCSTIFFNTIIKEFRFGENILLYLITIIILLVVLFSLIKQTIENNRLTNKYDKLLEFMTSYEKEIEKIRILRHETKNEFLTIKSKIIDKEKNKEIIKYINDILKDNSEIKYEMYAKFGYLPANGIKGLCYFKTQEAVNKGIKVSINISSRIENSAIYKLSIKQNRDLGKILGVFLDNAIEGALESEEKEFGIEAYINMKNECEFIICNSCNEKMSINNNSAENKSTKGKNRGHGLILVNHLINKNNNTFSLETKIIKGLYVQTLKIKKSTRKN